MKNTPKSRRALWLIPVVILAALVVVLAMPGQSQQTENADFIVGIQGFFSNPGSRGGSGNSTPAQNTPSGGQSQQRMPIAVDGGNAHSVILYNDGSVATIGDDTYAQRSTSGWSNITQISTFADHTLGLKADGTVVAAGLNSDGQCEVYQWRNIVSVAAGSRHSVGVRSDGTVVAVGANDAGQCNVEQWRNVKAVAASNSTTFGLTYDGRVLTCGSFTHRNLSGWSEISCISVSTNHVAVAHVNGTVSVAGANDKGQCDNMGKWMDTTQIVAGYGFTAGLRAKGSVWVHGCDDHDEHSAMQWTDMVAIGSGREHLLGIRSDGTLFAKGTNDKGQCDVYWLNQQLKGN